MPKKKDDDLDLRFDPREELGLDPKCTFDVHIGEDGVGPKSDDGPAPDDPDVIDFGQPPDYAYYSREDPSAYEVKPLGPKKELRKNKPYMKNAKFHARSIGSIISVIRATSGARNKRRSKISLKDYFLSEK